MRIFLLEMDPIAQGVETSEDSFCVTLFIVSCCSHALETAVLNAL